MGVETGADAGEPLISGAGATADGTVFDFVITGTKQDPASRAAFVSGSSTSAGEITCLRLVHDRAVFGIADTESGGETVFREFYVEDDGERLVALGSERSAPKKHCSGKLPRTGSGTSWPAATSPSQRRSSGEVARDQATRSAPGAPSRISKLASVVRGAPGRVTNGTMRKSVRQRSSVTWQRT